MPAAILPPPPPSLGPCNNILKDKHHFGRRPNAEEEEEYPPFCRPMTARSRCPSVARLKENLWANRRSFNRYALGAVCLLCAQQIRICGTKSVSHLAQTRARLDPCNCGPPLKRSAGDAVLWPFFAGIRQIGAQNYIRRGRSSHYTNSNNYNRTSVTLAAATPDCVCKCIKEAKNLHTYTYYTCIFLVPLFLD